MSVWQERTLGWIARAERTRGGRLALVASHYLVALVSVGAATLFRVGLDPVLGEHHPFTLYFASVAITAWYGGMRPAMLATVLSYFGADWFFITPRFEFNFPHENLDEFLALAAFLFSCFAIAITSAIMRRALAQARRKQQELESEIAERKRAEQALQRAQAQLREHATQLEERVRERTGHLQETVRSLEGVCYHLAHDLRAPLRAMQGFTTILMREHLVEAEGTVYLQHISQASKRMDLLIRGLMEYGRMGHGKFPLRCVDPHAVLQNVVSRFEQQIISAQAEVSFDDGWPCLRGNEELLRIVFSNLLSNALKFVPEGVPPRIRISAELVHSDPDSDSSLQGTTHGNPQIVRLTISDNGIGIPSEYLSRAFLIFERLHPRKSYPGTGMGLAIVAKAIERMDGRTGVASTPGVGSHFWFELPAAPAPPEGQNTVGANLRTADAAALPAA